MIRNHFRPTPAQVHYMQAAVANHVGHPVVVQHLPQHQATAAHTTAGGAVLSTHSIFHVPAAALDFEVVLDRGLSHPDTVHVRPIVGYLPFDPTQHGGTLAAAMQAAVAYQRDLQLLPR